ncbi:ABC transporter ATP-binding protein [Neptunomonas antarctica]|uniref:sn-glycerol 3-phosphate transport system ATP-binding protein n=1 Tax=Neptunomonas antarctica TaxID=619304 RepID=A0A1N7NHD9_9GAMM|nr:ABC transporter ATP-binding protein [Neptunomonas antarctica]SIS97833.1 sn-glycerol 3-phosphate transport system ATP-binding protein [Neptunomonas antarctica]
MSFLNIQGLSKQWADTRVVEDINFEICEGEFIALLGPSGCGKSTTLKMIAGLETPTAGNVILNGQNITNRTPGQRQLSMVFQSYALFPHLSVKENIVFGLKARKVPVNERNKRLRHAVELVNLGDQINKKPSELSGGQCQRVALARAIVSQAPLCLMDEPLSNLDTKLRNEMRTEIRALQKQLGLTVLYVTHDQVEAMSMADRIILLNAGRIEQMGSPQALYNEPASSFVARFIGHPPMSLMTRDKHLIGIRPEHITLCKSGYSEGIATHNPNKNPNNNASVIHCDYHGADTLISVDFQGSALMLSLQGHHLFQAGHPLAITWESQHEHYFSAKTGLRTANL